MPLPLSYIVPVLSEPQVASPPSGTDLDAEIHFWMQKFRKMQNSLTACTRKRVFGRNSGNCASKSVRGVSPAGVRTNAAGPAKKCIFYVFAGRGANKMVNCMFRGRPPAKKCNFLRFPRPGCEQNAELHFSRPAPGEKVHFVPLSPAGARTKTELHFSRPAPAKKCICLCYRRPEFEQNPEVHYYY